MLVAGRKALAITERQFSVLKILWEEGPRTVRELMEQLPGGDRQPYTTVLGLLQNMQKAGLVTAEKEGLVHRYHPAVSRGEATGNLLSDFLARFFHGSAEQLILGLVDAEQLEPDELKAIEAKLSSRSGRRPAPNDRPSKARQPRRRRP